MNLKNKIEWLDGGATFNPVTGCYGPDGVPCEYCYAKKIAERFGGIPKLFQRIVDLQNPLYINNRKSPFPYGFQPTFHRYRLDEPQRIKKPQNIFVCSMADLFQEWIPDEWIQQVFDVCATAPWHRYLFLTKNWYRYEQLQKKGQLPTKDNYWFGTTITNDKTDFYWSEKHNYFVSIEPIMGDFSSETGSAYRMKWAIIGAETGSRKDKVIPRREWIENIVNKCRKQYVPVFMKNSLKGIWGEPLIQEFPWKEEV